MRSWMKNRAAFVLYIVVTSCIIGSTIVHAEDKIDLRVGVMHFPPFSDATNPQKPTGLFIKMIEESLKRASVSYSAPEGFPSKRHYTYLGQGVTQFTIGSKYVPVYHGKVIYSKKPIYTLQGYAMSLPGKPLPSSNPQDWRGNIILIAGYGYGTLKKKLENMQDAGLLKLTNAPAHLNLLRMLKAKRGDFAIDYSGPVERALKKVEIPNLQKKIIFDIDLYLVLNKKIPDGENLMDRIEKAFFALKAEGRFDQ
jgi:hypothetical protein